MSSNFNINNNGSTTSLSNDPTQDQPSVPTQAADAQAPLNYLMELLNAFTNLTNSELSMEEAHADMYSLDNKMVKEIQDSWSSNISGAITAAKAKNSNGSINTDDQLNISTMQSQMNTEVSSGQSVASGMQSQLNMDAGNLQKASDLFPVDQIMSFSASVIAK